MKLAPSRVSLNNSIRNGVGNSRKLKLGSNVASCLTQSAVGSQTPLAQSWDPATKSRYKGAKIYSNIHQYLPKDLGPSNNVMALNKRLTQKEPSHSHLVQLHCPSSHDSLIIQLHCSKAPSRNSKSPQAPPRTLRVIIID